MNLQLTDLNTAIELDRAALIQVLGAGTYGWRTSTSVHGSSRYSSRISFIHKGGKRIRVRKYFRQDKRVVTHRSQRKVLTGMRYL